ncbi:MAG TPA: heme peroxidase family protein [Thermoanaerobaculia bacterium]|nr:heme peroxidase family protein [Thermoanaerobaculia bacterium]
MDRSETSTSQPFSPPRHGVTLHRALEPGRIHRSAFHDPGVFGRMFPALPAAEFDPATLAKLAAAMLDDGAGEDNPAMPAGFTFLGQFVDHDITFDPTSSLERQNDPEAIHNFRTPLLELDSVYGAGPSVQPFLYDSRDRDKLLIGVDSAGGPNDLPRNRQGVALTGDPRNDENLIVSQLHLAFLKLHNKVVAGVRNGTIATEPGEPVFEAAQRLVRWHYQWIVANEFLRKILGETLWKEMTEPLFFRWKEEPFIPVEFAVAAYRFGHSQVRAKYRINATAGFLPIFPDLAVGPNLTADRVLRSDRTVELRHFFDGTLLGKKIDSVVSGPLGKLPSGGGSLPLRNLQRGVAFGLPSGQRVAKALGLKPLTDDQLRVKGEQILPPGKAPLWYYILKEAEVLAKGEHLGPVGGRIVGEVLLGLLKGDARSYLNQDPLWQPSLGATMADLVAFTETPRRALSEAA